MPVPYSASGTCSSCAHCVSVLESAQILTRHTLSQYRTPHRMGVCHQDRLRCISTRRRIASAYGDSGGCWKLVPRMA
eukprot:3941848-Rhodomonas_salina.2